MKILKIDNANIIAIQQAERLLMETFECYNTPEKAKEEVANILSEERVCLGAFDQDELIGFVGAIPQYSHAWELHPLLVKKHIQTKGIGRALLSALENELSKKGILTIYLGTDDENFSTTLSDSNLFHDTFKKIENIKNKNKHPYEFYIKCGYKIIGVIPNASGKNKPDIWMAKEIGEE